MSDQPTVSVVMITYNGEKYIRQQLDSLLAQTYPFTELIVQDDCSTDSTPSIVEEYAQHDKRIRFFINEHNMGWNLNFITAMRRATCDFIALSDQDDIWYSSKIEKEIRQIGSNDLCFCYRYKDSEYTEHGKVLATPQPDFESLLFTSHIPGHDMLFRRTMLDKIDTWNKYIPYDWWLAIQAHLLGGITLVQEPLNWHRPHDTSASAQLMKKEWARAEHTSWQPYIFGWKAYRRFQKMEDWQWLYGYIQQHTADGCHPLVHRMSTLMLTPGLPALLQLCGLCMKHRRKVHERFGGNSLLCRIRGFFYPLMWTYNNNSSFLRKPEKES